MKLSFLTVTPSFYCEDDVNCGNTNLNDGRYDHLQKIFHANKINSTNWPAPNIWVFIAQLVEYRSARAMKPWVRILLKRLKLFSG